MPAGAIGDSLTATGRHVFALPTLKAAAARIRFLLKRAEGSTRAVAQCPGASRRTTTVQRCPSDRRKHRTKAVAARAEARGPQGPAARGRRPPPAASPSPLAPEDEYAPVRRLGTGRRAVDVTRDRVLAMPAERSGLFAHVKRWSAWRREPAWSTP